MTALTFTKGHGTENDFVLLFDEHGKLELNPAMVRFLCDRRAGIGADGVIRAVRVGSMAPGAVAGQDALDGSAWFMDYWNSDGSVSEMCGNGARVFGAFLESEAAVDLRGGVTILTRGGQRTITALGDGMYSVGMGTWRLGRGEADDDGDAVASDSPGSDSPALDSPAFDSTVEASGLHPSRPALSVDVGNPHRVVALASIAELEALDLTVAPSVTPLPADGANVEFAVTLGGEVIEGTTHGRVRMRVHERGSGETRSCGTGACAVALAVRSWAGVGAPDVWDVEVPGGVVTVRVSGDRTTLEGPAVLVAKGTVALP
jgi:diaminopimelate epimerase